MYPEGGGALERRRIEKKQRDKEEKNEWEIQIETAEWEKRKREE